MHIPIALLSKENLQHNVNVIRSQAPKSQIMVMLKANAYGHGIRSTATRIDHLIDYIGVARIDEALALRKIGIKAPICIMQGVFSKEDVILSSCNNFELMIHDFAQIECLNSIMHSKVNVWIKVDTGMGRLGFKMNEVHDVYNRLRSLNTIEKITLTTHFACANDKNHYMNTLQMERFNKLANDFSCPKSMANSAGIFNFPSSHYDIVRPGIAIYGVSPLNDKTAQELNLKPVMSLLAKIISIRNLERNSTIGYDAEYQTKKDLKVATLAIGYGDGYPFSVKQGTKVLIKNHYCNIIGKVSMDMMTIDINDYDNIYCGDFATLWGNNLPIENIINMPHYSFYDVLTQIQMRVKFYWN